MEGPGGVLGYKSDGDVRRPFLGLKFSAWTFFGFEIFWWTFFALKILARTFFGVDENRACLKFCDRCTRNE